jgi:hypothetical protein
MDVRENVFVSEQYDGNWPSSNAVDFVSFIVQTIESIPEEYRNEARIEIDSNLGYEDSTTTSIEIYYYRPETEEEKEKREKKEIEQVKMRKEFLLYQLKALEGNDE